MNFFHTHISPEAVRLAQETLVSTHVSEGKMAARFEAELARGLQLSRPVTVNSGTSALHLALAVAGVGPGDEVILPAQTFVATGLAILMQRAVPAFADIQPETGNLDPESVRSRLTPRTRAIMPVHWAGYPCDMDEINTLALEHGLAVVEDAAHALGAFYKGRPVGSLSRFTAFSFQAIKHLTTGDGGAVCCLTPEDERELKRRRWFGIDRELDLPGPLGERLYDLETIGFKYHLNDLAASVGLGNLSDFPRRLAQRREIARQYRHEFRETPGLHLLRQDPDRESACWLFTVRVQERDAFVRAMKSRGVPVSVVHQRIDRNSLFGGPIPDLPGQARFDAEQISLPLHEGLTTEDVELVIRSVKAGW